jgi:hypothetical protein
MPAFRAPKLDCGELSKWTGKAPALHLTLQKGRGRVRHPGRQTPRKNPTTATAARSATSQLELRDVTLLPGLGRSAALFGTGTTVLVDMGLYCLFGVASSMN